MKEFPIFRDIRFYKDHEQNQQNFDSAGLSLEFTHTIGKRFSSFLNAKKFRIGPFHHIYFYLRESGSADSYTIKPYPEDWCRSVEYSVDLSQLIGADPYAFVCKMISRVLTESTEQYATDRQEIESLTSLAITERQRLKIPLFERKVRQTDLRFYFVIRENYGEFAQLFVDLIDRNSGTKTTYFIVESSIYELKSLVSRATIENRTLLLHPRKSQRAQHDVQSFVSRGFSSPICIHLDSQAPYRFSKD